MEEVTFLTRSLFIVNKSRKYASVDVEMKVFNLISFFTVQVSQACTGLSPCLKYYCTVEIGATLNQYFRIQRGVKLKFPIITWTQDLVRKVALFLIIK